PRQTRRVARTGYRTPCMPGSATEGAGAPRAHRDELDARPSAARPDSSRSPRAAEARPPAIQGRGAVASALLLASFGQFFDPRDGARSRVDREADLVAGVDHLQHCGVAGLVAHGHRLHEPLDLAVLEDELLSLLPDGYDGALTRDELRLRPELRVLARHVGPAMAGQRVRVGDDGPAILLGQFALPGGHRSPFRLERLDQAALAPPPEPEVTRHLGHHLAVGEVGGLERQVGGPRALAISPLAMAERAPGFVDLLALRD